MKNLWAPWRRDYVVTPRQEVEGCVFCDAIDSDDPLILKKNQNSYAIMNRFPYNAGHIMVIPYRHVSDLADLDEEESLDVMSLTREVMNAIRSTMKPDGFNVGCNIGSAAGAGIEEHLHIHIVPRWNGDINFMPVIADVHMMSEHIEHTMKKIREAMS